MSALAELRAYDEVIEFLASGASPEQILHFEPSDWARARAKELLEKNREGRGH